jgi:hypothetical protein
MHLAANLINQSKSLYNSAQPTGIRISSLTGMLLKTFIYCTDFEGSNIAEIVVDRVGLSTNEFISDSPKLTHLVPRMLLIRCNLK